MVLSIQIFQFFQQILRLKAPFPVCYVLTLMQYKPLNLQHYSTPSSSESCQYWMSNTKQRYSSTNVQIFRNIK